MPDYAITTKKTRLPISKDHYLDYLDKLSDYGEVSNVNFEDTRGLHIHFILTTADKIKNSKLYPTKYGWNAKSVPIYNRTGWLTYSRKDHQKCTHVTDIYEHDVHKNPLFNNGKSLFK